MLTHFIPRGRQRTTICGRLIARPVATTDGHGATPCPDCERAIIAAGTLACPACGDDMPARRVLVRHHALTGGVCSECRITPSRTAAQIAQARALDCFGTGRTGERASTERCIDAEHRAGGRREWL